MIIGFSVIAYVMSQVHQQQLELRLSMDQREAEKRPDNNDTNNGILNWLQSMFISDLVKQQVQKPDMDRYLHPLVPPVRRGVATYGLNGGPSIPINIPTRGEYGPFHQMGYLHNPTDPDQAMPLMGRRIHSNQYEYYTFHHGNPNIKIPIKNNREIEDGSDVTVSTYPGVTFNAAIYEVDVPRYVPY